MIGQKNDDFRSFTSDVQDSANGFQRYLKATELPMKEDAAATVIKNKLQPDTRRRSGHPSPYRR